MIKILIAAIIILLGLSLSPHLTNQSGYIYIAAGDYQLETSLLVAALLLLVLFAVIKLILWATKSTFHLLVFGRYFPINWRKQKSKQLTFKGAIAIAEGNWSEAEKAMYKGAKKAELPALNYLAAAKAAQQQGESKRCEYYLALAEKEPNTEQAVTILRSRNYLEQAKLSQARLELEKLVPNSQSNKAVITLALDIYQQQQDWQSLKEILPFIQKKQLFTTFEFERLHTKVTTELLSQATKNGAEELEKTWQWLTRTERTNDSNIAAYTVGLSLCREQAKASKILQKQLKKEISQPLLVATAKIITAADSKLLQQLEALANTQDNNPDYHYAMALINEKLKDYKQAKYHWQRVCHSQPNQENWTALAKLQERLGDSLGAIHSYRNALDKSAKLN